MLEDGNRIARFECEENFFATLDEIGQMPLPPYITEKLKDRFCFNYLKYSNRKLCSSSKNRWILLNICLAFDTMALIKVKFN